jgi:fermentation-respiration switch protein FrsA (DUF1100 family)
MAWLKILVIAAVTVYLAVALLVWVAQEKLLFYPQRTSGRPVAPAGWQIEEVRIQARDGTQLAGVLVKPPVERAPLVIYFGGNAEEVTLYASLAAQTYGERAVLLVNYRGYGDSGGSPGERELVADGIEIHDWAVRRPDIDAARVAFHGRSLGTGVAVQVAAARPPRCVILTSPFDSARAVAQRIYPWLPVGLIIRHPFDSAAVAPGLHMPALILIGSADDIIPPSHSLHLASVWGSPAERVIFDGFGHNDISMNPKYDEAIQGFLARCA